MATNEELEARIEQLEYRVKELVGLVNDEIDPFSHAVLTEELTEDQADSIINLMSKIRAEIDAGNPPPFTEFEERVYQAIPSRRGDYHFAARLVRSLKKDRYADVYEYLKKSGMGNL